MVRTPSFDKKGMKKGSWTPEEDRKLVAYVTRYGCWNWRQLPRFAGLARCGKSCRLRWLNYLKPDIKRGNYTPQEEDIIVRLHQKIGSKWSVIASNLPGRTDNDIKNHWHSSLKKRFQRVTRENDCGSKQAGLQVAVTAHNNSVSAGTGVSPHLSCSESSSTTHHSNGASNENLVIDDFDLQLENENIWSETFLAENDSIFQDTDTTALQNIPGYSSCWAVSPESSSGEYFAGENVADGQFNFEEPTTVMAEAVATEDFWGEQQYCVADVSHVPNELFAPFVFESDDDFFGPGYDVDLWSQTDLRDHFN